MLGQVDVVRKTNGIANLRDLLDPLDIAGQAFRIDRHATDLDGSNPRDDVAFGITDLTPEEANAEQIGALVRGHWGIETRLHWERDMIYDEDRSQVRTQNGPRVMATLRNTAIGLLHRLDVPNL